MVVSMPEVRREQVALGAEEVKRIPLAFDEADALGHLVELDRGSLGRMNATEVDAPGVLGRVKGARPPGAAPRP
jgi:hypothetical protein